VPELIISVLAAVAVHEFGHIAAMKLCGINHGGIMPRFFGLGIKADLSGVSYRQEIAVFAAGSLADIILAVCLCKFPDISFAAAAYGIFNLMPTHFLDGGEILRLILQICGAGDRTIRRALSVSSYTVTVGIWTLAVYLAVKGAGVAMLITAAYMMFVTLRTPDT
jgi:stage IV sporulation protein FB